MLPAGENAPSTWKPTATGERYFALDVLRGLALLGVVIVNCVTFFRVSLFQHILIFHTDPGWLNHAADFLVAGLLEFKAVTLFCLLFGVGLGVQTERAAVHQAQVRRFLARRFLVLLGFGLCHLLLVSNVDVLTLYALCGLLLLPFIELSATTLGGLGLVAIVLNFVLPLGSMLPTEAMMHSQAALATQVYATGSFYKLLLFRWHETRVFIAPLLLYILPRTLGLMLLGMAFWRTGVLQQPARHRQLIWAVFGWAGFVGAGATVIEVWGQACGHALMPDLSPQLVEASSYIPLALAYAAATLLWLSHVRPGLGLTSIAALGQMALTNYLVQSVLLSLIFYGYGLGLCGRLGAAVATALALLIYLFQLWASRLWLKHYTFGPCEWLWRSLTYGAPQAIRRATD